MLDRIFPFLAYIRYFLFKEDRHSLQAPFAYSTYEGLIKHRKSHQNQDLAKRRKGLLRDTRKISIEDHGSGSIALKNAIRTIADITKHSSSPIKYANLYQYFCSLTPATNVLELGTCVGITTCFLAKSTLGKVTTFEGAPTLAEVAKANFSAHKNVALRQGKIEIELPSFLRESGMIDFVLIDANHAYPPTMLYWSLLLPKLHHDSIVAIGDIYRSKGMKKAWDEIKSAPSVTMSMDFYECGILFFKKGINKQHYVLHY